MTELRAGIVGRDLETLVAFYTETMRYDRDDGDRGAG